MSSAALEKGSPVTSHEPFGPALGDDRVDRQGRKVPLDLPRQRLLLVVGATNDGISGGALSPNDVEEIA